jgi:DNA-binding PadR family transcriptional regulator
MLRYLILGLLKDGSARHGYALMRDYRDASGRRLSVGNVYRELQRLKADGLVQTGRNPPGADSRRLPYEITDAGRAAFQRWFDGPIARDIGEPEEDEHALRAFLVVTGSATTATHVFAEWKDRLTVRYHELTRQRSVVNGQATARGTSPGSLWLRRRLLHMEADLRFVRCLEAAVNDGGSERGSRRPPSGSHPVATPGTRRARGR